MEKEKVELTSQSRIMIIDTETTNSLDDPVVYDVGFEVFDLEGNTYESCSMINTEVFNDPALMSTAYYADKIPQYMDRVLTGQSVMIPWKSIKNLGSLLAQALRHSLYSISVLFLPCKSFILLLST